MDARAWRLTICAAVLMGLVAGGRAAGALFVSPLNTATGAGLAALSLALALGQLGVGLLQPVIGAVADRHGAARLIVAGALLLATATVMPAIWTHTPLVLGALVLGTMAGGAVGSNGLLLGQLNRAMPPARVGFAVAVVGAGASAGQLVLGPAAQWGIARFGWDAALAASGLLVLLALPLGRAFRDPPPPAPAPSGTPGSAAVGKALRDPRFWRLAASFGVCGFHVGFLGAHMPGVIDRCGLPASLAGAWLGVAGAANLAGSLAIGWALRRGDAARWLAGVYLLRALGVAALLLLPAGAGLLLAFAVLMGATQMATLPPTSQLVARAHGVQRLGTLFGLVMLVHQAGSFAGIWLGGWAAEATGSDTALWTADLVLALLAAALVWPLRSRRGPAHIPPPLPAATGSTPLALSLPVLSLSKGSARTGGDPFSLSPSKGSSRGAGFDELSPNGGEIRAP